MFGVLSVGVTDQVGVEVVEVGAFEATAVAPPRIGLAVEASVQEVDRLVGEGDGAVLALPVRVGLVVVAARLGHDGVRDLGGLLD